MFPQNQIAPENLAQSPQSLLSQPPIDEKYLHNQAKGLQGPLDEDILEDRKDRFFGLEKPKTANRAFGSVSDFLLFFENRNHRIKDFAKKFTEIEKAMSLDRLYDEIQPVLRDCLAKQWEKKLDHKKEEITNEYSKEFEERFQNWDDFYGKILYVYTLSGCLYRNMNLYLRIENWMELNDLLPYTFCLLKAFLRDSIVKESFDSLKKRLTNETLVLYRGAKFETNVMTFYDPNKTKNFSWHGVTSTSTKQSAALNFTKEATEDQTAVLFIIEANLAVLNSKQVNFLDIKNYSHFSGEEEIILAPGSIFELAEIKKKGLLMLIYLRLVTNTATLAYQGQFMHGTLQAAMRERNELKIVSLKKKELSRAIKHCEGNDLIEDLEFSLCKFNEKSAENLVRGLYTMKGLKNFTLSSVILKEKKDLEKILKCLGKKKIERLELLATLGKDKHVIILAENLEYLKGLKALKISFEEESKITGETMKILYEKVMENLAKDCVFELSTVNDLKIETKGMLEEKRSLGRFLERRWPVKKGWNEMETQIQQLEGYFPEKRFEGERSALKVIGNPRMLMYHCENDKKIRGRNLQEILERLGGDLMDVSLRFDWDSKISDSELKRLGLEKPQQLNSLGIVFEGCEKITDEGVKNLCIEGIQYLGGLRNFSLGFVENDKITEAAIEDLCTEGIIYLEKLVSLSLSFEKCRNIKSIEGMTTLAIGGLQMRSATLRNLELNFSSCSWVTDKDIGILCSEGIQCLSGLESLTLEFSKCWKITDLGIKNLCSLGLQHLKCLEKLKLNFETCVEVTNNGVKTLCCEGLQHVKKSLKSLHLIFGLCDKITYEGIKILYNEGLRHLDELESLNIDFNRAPRLTDEVLKFLCCHGMRDLNKLKALSLSFFITNNGLKSLCAEGIRLPETLEHLQIGFNGCFDLHEEYLHLLKDTILKGKLPNLLLPLEIQENTIASQRVKEAENSDAVSIVCQSSMGYYLQEKSPSDTSFNMTDLLEKNVELVNSESLSLGFEDCDVIRNDIFDYICLPLTLKETLRSLHVDFAKCRPLRDEGITSFSSEILRNLPLLNSLNLNFDRCEQISDYELKELCQKGIQPITGLTSLQLSFNDCIHQINDTSLKIIGLLKMNSLLTLNLSFNRCYSVSNNGLKALLVPGNFQSLKDLSLSFDGCVQITDDGIGYLATVGMNSLSSLSLSFDSLNFHPYHQITDKGIKVLASQWIKNLKDLRNLHLNFNFMPMTDSGLEVLCCEGLASLKLLTHLSLSFDFCRQISDVSLEILAQHLGEKLTDLQLSFSACEEITDKGLGSLWTNGIGRLGALKSLFLNFSWTRVSEEFMRKDFSHMGKYVLIEGNRISRQLNNLALKRNHKEENLMARPSVQITSKYLHAYHLQEKYQDPKPSILDLLSQKATLETLSLGFNDIAYSDSDLKKLSCEEISSLTDLKDLRIGFQGCLSLTENGFKTLFEKGIRNLTSITSLNLRFIHCKGFTNVALTSLCSQVLQNLALLSTLQLVFDGSEGVNDVSLQILSKEGLQYCKSSLTSLYLSFNGSKGITDVGLKSLCSEGLQHVKLLNRLQLNFNDCERISDTGLKSLGKDGLKNLNRLTELYLWFDRCRHITEIGSKSLVCEGIRSLKQLTRLELSFQWAGFTDVELEILGSEGLQHLEKLNSLSLNLTGSLHITDKGLMSLCQHLKSSLTSLTLNLQWCEKITNKGLKTLNEEALRKIKSLEKLSLSFDGYQPLTDEGLGDLFHGLVRAQTLDSFKILRLEFLRCRGISDSGLENFSREVLQQLKSLNTLQLSFDGCMRISNKGIESLVCEGIQHLRGLKSLSLAFISGQGITDFALACLSREGLQHLKYLETLQLRFEKCGQLTSFGLLELSSEGIQSLPLLENLTLSLNNCPEISNYGLERLFYDGIQHVKSLKTICLSFYGCVQVKYEHLESLKYKISQLGLPSLQLPLSIFSSDPFFELRSSGLSESKAENSVSIMCQRRPAFCLEENPNQLQVRPLELLKNHQHMTGEIISQKIIENISLKFQHPDQVTDEIFEAFRFSEELKDLKTLSINLSQCKQITDFGVKSLCTGLLKNLYSLTELYLILNGCEKITDLSIDSLFSEGLDQIKSLRVLHISFDDCRKITDEGLKIILAKGVPRHSGLCDLKLSFSNLPEVSHSTSQAFFKILRYFGFEKNQVN